MSRFVNFQNIDSEITSFESEKFKENENMFEITFTQAEIKQVLTFIPFMRKNANISTTLLQSTGYLYYQKFNIGLTD